MTSALRPVVIDIGMSLSCQGFRSAAGPGCRPARSLQVVYAALTAFSANACPGTDPGESVRRGTRVKNVEAGSDAIATLWPASRRNIPKPPWTPAETLAPP